MHFHYQSFDKHFSFLSKHDKSSVLLHTVLDLKFVQIKTRQIRNIQPWIVKEMDGKLADVIVETYLQFMMSRVLRIC